MGKKDSIAKVYMRENAVFADIFNFYLYGGQKKIHPEELRSLDTTELSIPYLNESSATTETAGKKIYHTGNTILDDIPVQKYRDILKTVIPKSDDRAIYLLGIENQADIHYAMPVKVGLYDFLQYDSQITETASLHKREKTSNKISTGEFLSGFHKNDRLKPVITLTVYFGAEPWDGPQSLHEMFDEHYAELIPYIQDYRIHLIEPAALKADELCKFNSSLREVLGFIKYSKDKEKLKTLLKTNENFMHMDRDAVRMIQTYTNTKISFKEEEGSETNMCIAIDEMMDDSKEEGAKMALDLAKFLIRDKRFEDLERITEDISFRNRLFEEYHIDFHQDLN